MVSDTMFKLSEPNISENAIAAVVDVLRSGNLVHGKECESFEHALKDYLGCADVVLVSSGTAALHLSLVALGIGTGDAVLVPDFTFPATANVVKLVGATPVIIDVDQSNYCIDLMLLEQRIKEWSGPEKLRAIMPVHEFGYPVDMTVMKALAHQYGLLLIEDAACALGADHQGQKVGTFGSAGCFSFHPRKTLTTGEGGAIACQDPALASRLRLLRNHGMKRSVSGMLFSEPGFNYRLTNFQAALGLAQLPLLDQWISARRALAKVYMNELADLEGLVYLPSWHDGHSWQTFMIRLADHLQRSRIVESLKSVGYEVNLGAQSLTHIGIYGVTSGNECGARLYTHGLALPFCERYDSQLAKNVAAQLKLLLASNQ